MVLSARELRPAYAVIIVASLLTAATGLLMPFIISRATDLVVSAQAGHGDHVREILLLAVALFVTDLANTLVSNLGGYFGDLMAVRLRTILSTRYYEKLMRLPQRYFDNELTGRIISRLQRSITETTQFLNGFANNFFPMLLTVGAVLVVSIIYSWPLAVLLAVVFPAFVWLTTLTSRKWQRIERTKNAHIDEAGGRFAEVVQQIRVVRSFVAERRELDLFRRHYTNVVGLTREQSRWWHEMDSLRRGVLNLMFFGIYAIIFVRTAQGAFTVGTMVLLIQLVNMARVPVTMMSFLVDASQRAIAGSRDYFAVMAEPDDEWHVGEGRSATSAASGTDVVIEFDAAGFGYETGEDVLSDVSFSVRRGERVALVGESGGGKTTIVNLLLGFYRLRSGHLRLLGSDITDLSIDEVRADVGVVFQDPALFSGTIRENIAYGRPAASEGEVVEAARNANASTFIERFPDGYDTLIGERGLKLSGGQRQRIAVARAILKDAPILVLDEATSALDTKAERQVQAGLDHLMA
ncbi:MAG TPA: ABC transporter ATP-binding protein, partial [Propionibacteriaceae bacterium]|nr:ABC transporter ATP-binding protein [Propionibacteriaceae bacterium]